MLYSPTTKGFYTNEIHGDTVPKDVVTITDAQHKVLLEGQAKGMVITSDKNGYPCLVAPSSTKEQLIKRAIGEIDKQVENSISALPYNYGSFEELSSWLGHPKYKDEATVLKAWCMKCYDVQNNIVEGKIKIDDTTVVINLLPKFPF